MQEEKVINGVLHKHTDSGWIPYSLEELTISLQIAQVNAEMQYHKGWRDATQKHMEDLKKLVKHISPTQQQDKPLCPMPKLV